MTTIHQDYDHFSRINPANPIESSFLTHKSINGVHFQHVFQQNHRIIHSTHRFRRTKKERFRLNQQNEAFEAVKKQAQ